MGAAEKEGPLLYEHIDDFSKVYPDVRVYLTDNAGTILASSHQLYIRGSLADMPELRGALHEKPFTGITHLVFSEAGNAVAEPMYSYALIEPIDQEGKCIGAVLATFPLDRGYLDNTEQKESLALALRIGPSLVAFNADHPDPNADLKAGTFALRSLPGGRTIAFTSFTPDGIGTTPGPVTVLAAKDVTAEFHTSGSFLWYRMLVLLAIAAAALVVGIAIANPMVKAIREIARVLPGVSEKRYETVRGVHTGDELQKLAETYNHMIGELLAARRQTEAFGKYLSRAARDAAEHGDVHLGGTTLPATVLFSDIRSFTTLCERMEPEHVLSLLNRYFTEMVGAVVRHQGIVDKFIGDCIMAVWGPPNPRPGDALNAVKAAMEMRERLVKLNVAFAAAGLPQFRTGVGIHTGQVVAGNMGAETTAEAEGKMEYTVIGDTVNLASRLETMTKELNCDVLLSEDTYKLVASQVDVEPLQRIHVKGREQDVAVYRLIGLRPELVSADAVA